MAVMGAAASGLCGCVATNGRSRSGRRAATPAVASRSGAGGAALREQLARTSSGSSGRAARGPSPPVRALDAAMPFDFEHRAAAAAAMQEQKLKIGIVGFGTFGQFLAKRMVQAGHEVIATSRSPYHDAAAAMGVRYFTDADDFCEEHPDVVVLASSILSMQKVLAALPVQRLKRNTLFVDVLSVKQFPKTVLLRDLPPEMDILCTHPMFGPDSGKGAWTDLNMMFERVRVADDPQRRQRCDAFLQFFEHEGCRMVEMTCEEHDQMAASTQFITHTVGRMLGAMALKPTPIDTRGFQSLLSLVDNTANDSFELYYGLFMYNQNATQELERLEQAFDSVKRQLFTQLHNRLREQLGLEAVSSSVVITRGTAREAQSAVAADGSGDDGDTASAAANGSASAGAERRQQQQHHAAPALTAAEAALAAKQRESSVS